MKKQPPVGLVVEGNTTHSAVLRLSSMAAELGPVKAAAPRLASRVCKLLRAGYPVEGYYGLQAARLVLVHVPDSAVPRIVGELCNSDLVFKDLSFVLCESWLTMEALNQLKERGANVATLVNALSVERNWFIAEGQTSAVRQIRRLIEQSQCRMLEIDRGAKHLLFAAELLAGALPVPLLISAQQALRACGISGNHLYALFDQLAQKMLRDLVKGSRNTLGPMSQCSAEIASAHLSLTRRLHPEFAELIDRHLAEGNRRPAAKAKRK